MVAQAPYYLSRFPLFQFDFIYLYFQVLNSSSSKSALSAEQALLSSSNVCSIDGFPKMQRFCLFNFHIEFVDSIVTEHKNVLCVHELPILRPFLRYLKIYDPIVNTPNQNSILFSSGTSSAANKIKLPPSSCAAGGNYNTKNPVIMFYILFSSTSCMCTVENNHGTLIVCCVTKCILSKFTVNIIKIYMHV